MTEDVVARLQHIAALGIQILPVGEIHSHFVMERDGFAVLVERHGMGFGSVGGPGMLTEHGFAALVDRAGTPWFVGKGHDRPASAAEAEAARRLFTDLKSALS